MFCTSSIKLAARQTYCGTDSKRQAMPAQLENSNLQALPVILSWTHYERLMRIKNKEIRDWYMKEAAEQMWNYRTLNRNINTQYYVCENV